MCVWHIRVLRQDDAAAITDAALAGNQEATLLLSSSASVARQIKALTEPNAAALTCLLCSEPLWQGNLPTAIVIVTEWDDAAALDTHAVCCDCFSMHRTKHALASAVLTGCGARLGTPLRQLPLPVAMAGHA
jgi:hypothetical protein